MAETQTANGRKYRPAFSFLTALTLLGCAVVIAVEAKMSVTTTAPTTAPTTSPPTAPAVKPGFEDGPFQEVSEQIARLMTLAWTEDKLLLDRDNWKRDIASMTEAQAIKYLTARIKKVRPKSSEKSIAEEAKWLYRMSPPESAFKRLRMGVKGLRSGSTGGIGGGRFSEFTSRKFLAARMEFNRKGDLTITLSELTGPGRTIEVTIDAKGSLAMAISGEKSGLLLEIGRSSREGFVVKHTVGGKVVLDGSSKSFRQFYAAHRLYVEEEMFPLLKHVGIGTPRTPYSAEVKKATLARLRGLPTPGKIAQGQKLIEQMNSKLYKKRQEASKLLAADVEIYRDLIARTIRNPSTPAETASRLKIIIKAKPKHNPVEKFVIVQGLVSNVDYLIDLLCEVKPADRAIVARALQQLTRQKIGPDPAEWKKWRSKKPSGKSTTKPGEPK